MKLKFLIYSIVAGIFSFAVGIASPTTDAADSRSFRNYTTSDGLPNNHIERIAQDRNGFLWIATWDGLSRFDGYEFRNYYHLPTDSTSLPSSLPVTWWWTGTITYGLKDRIPSFPGT